MDLKGKKVAILIEEMYEDLEFHYPRIRLMEAGADVMVVGTGKDSYPGKHGLPAKEDIAAEDADATDFDALVIPGGYSPDHMRRSKAMVQLVRDVARDDKPVAAICHGVWMMASAGLLQNRTVTSFFSIQDDLKNAGAEWVDREVVRDGNLITSRNPGDLPAFCATLIESLGGD